MRLSVIQSDQGYSVAAFGCSVTLDGNPLDCCVTADEEQGAVLCYVKDAEGNFMLDDSKGAIKTEQLKGTVVITVPEEYRDFIR